MKRKLISDYFVLAKKKNLESSGGIDLQELFKKLIGDSWYKVLQNEVEKTYFSNLWERIAKERETEKIYPPEHLIFNAFSTTPFDDVKVVIVGQDPYHQPNQAMGLSFSVPKGVPIPPSLRNIFAEIGVESTHGDLTNWSKQGVFLLNASLTVIASCPMSHSNYGWQTFTDFVIHTLNTKRSNLVFLLWGQSAFKKCSKIDRDKHLVLTAGHPSPLSYKFFKGCDHFQKANEYLKDHNITPIDWHLL